MKNTLLPKVSVFVGVTLLASSGWGFTTDKDSELIGASLTISESSSGGSATKGDLTVQGDTILGNEVSDTATVKGILNVEGNTTLGTVAVTTTNTINGDLTVTGTLTANIPGDNDVANPTLGVTNNNPLQFTKLPSTDGFGGWKISTIDENHAIYMRQGPCGLDDMNTLDFDEYGTIRFFTGVGLGSTTSGTPRLERMRIAQDGSVGISTTDPKRTLDVNGEVWMRGNVRMTQSEPNSVASTTRFYVDNGPSVFVGNVAIGQTTSDGNFNLYVNGNAYASGGYISGSDQRWKKGIKTLDDSLSKIAALRGVSYQWRQSEFPDKNFSEGEQMGIVAQEIEKVFPELVSEDSKGYKSVSYVSLVAPLIEAVKSLKQQNESQQATIDDLTARLNALENK